MKTNSEAKATGLKAKEVMMNGKKVKSKKAMVKEKEVVDLVDQKVCLDVAVDTVGPGEYIFDSVDEFVIIVNVGSDGNCEYYTIIAAINYIRMNWGRKFNITMRELGKKV